MKERVLSGTRNVWKAMLWTWARESCLASWDTSQSQAALPAQLFYIYIYHGGLWICKIFMAHNQDTLCFRINSAHLWSDVCVFDRYCCYVFPFLDNTVETEAQEGHNGIRCEICFIFVTFQMCEGPYWGEVSPFRDFSAEFQPKMLR